MAAISSGVASPRTTRSTGRSESVTTIRSVDKSAQPRDLPVPMPNSRWTRSQNASRSHSRASW
jgi:hypothetical protein